MGYNIKYYTPWYSKYTQGMLFIDELDGTDPSTRITLLPEGMQIKYDFTDWNDPIVKLNSTLQILNDRDDFYDLLDLVSNEERQFQVRIYDTDNSINLFTGFINTATANEKYRHNAPLKVTASNYLSKLRDIHPTIVDTIDRRSIIDILNETLKLTGKEDPIRVNMGLYEDSLSYGFGYGKAFNRCGISTENFWQNNIERDGGLDIIEKILIPFDNYIYWYDGAWYVERYDDIWEEPVKEFIEYQPDTSYDYGTTGEDVSILDSSINIKSLCFLEDAPTIGFIPGLNKIEVKLEGIPFSNLTNPFEPDNATFTTQPNPRYWYPTYTKEWVYYHTAGSASFPYIGPYKTFKNAWLRAGGYSPSDSSTGCATKFKMTIDPSAGTALKISLRWLPVVTGGTQNEADYDFYIRYYLKDYTGTYGTMYIMYDDDNSRWYRGSEPYIEDAINTHNVSGSDFKGTIPLETTIDIDLSDPSVGLSGDKTFIFGMMVGYYADAGDTPDTPLLGEYQGDYQIAATGDFQNNLITGTLNNAFINKKEIECTIYDIESLNYANGIFFNSEYSARSNFWTEDGITAYPLTDMLISNKAQLYANTRQKITGTIRSETPIRPFSLYYDSSQGYKQFVLTAYDYNVLKDEYRCTWNEYNTELTNINYE